MQTNMISETAKKNTKHLLSENVVSAHKFDYSKAHIKFVMYMFYPIPQGTVLLKDLRKT